ncbi:MAG: hypothetical protein KF721_00895 [Ignavibacteriaceae bacterium]|nr:hypothetical protein [Ignavibacteriaceae bacterium]HRI45972.1 hypothetical protein [Ignavibacteriaceae bacterium]
MKSDIFLHAILNRRTLQFFYETSEVILEPYYTAVDRFGNKVIYGRQKFGRGVEKFEYRKIANIHILDAPKFTPIIPIIPLYN